MLLRDRARERHWTDYNRGRSYFVDEREGWGESGESYFFRGRR